MKPGKEQEISELLTCGIKFILDFWMNKRATRKKELNQYLLKYSCDLTFVIVFNFSLYIKVFQYSFYK